MSGIITDNVGRSSGLVKAAAGGGGRLVKLFRRLTLQQKLLVQLHLRQFQILQYQLLQWQPVVRF